MAWKRSNAPLPPMPEDIVKYDPKWLQDIYTYDDIIKFQYDRLPDIKPPKK